MISRRFAYTVMAALFVAPIAVTTTAHAQAGGIPSTTAPSNSQGTPADSTGIVGGSRVGPSTTATPVRATHRHRVRHHRHHARANTSAQ